MTPVGIQRSRFVGALLIVSIALLVTGAACTSVDNVTEPSCTYGLAPPSANFDASGGTGQLNVTASGVCAWTADPPPGWITYTSQTSGSGDGTLSYKVAANPTVAVRTGMLTISGQHATVTQTAAACTFVVAPGSASFGASGGGGAVAIHTADACAWSAGADVSWITITSSARGSGDGEVDYTVAPNGSGTARSGTLTVAGQAVAIAQASAGCSFTVSPESTTFSSNGGSINVGVEAAGGCDWAASTRASWLHITRGDAGSGNGTVTVAADRNTGAARSDAVIIAGQAVTFTQAAGGAAPPPPPPACTYTLTADTTAFTALGGSTKITVKAGNGCAWTAVASAPWVHVTGNPSGSGNGTVNATVDPNVGLTGRTATITAAGQTVTLSEAGLTCSFGVNPSSADYSGSGGTGNVAITAGAGCAWTATSGATWITITGAASGSGNGSIAYTVTANAAPSGRAGAITIADKTVTISEGAACTFTVAPTSASFDSTKGNGSVQITTQAGCAWTAQSNDPWITIGNGDKSGTGTSTVQYAVDDNPVHASRTGTMTVAGVTVTVTQDGR